MSDGEQEKNKQLRNFLSAVAGVGTEILEHEHQWNSVTSHCLIEAARACVFAEILGFDAELKKDIVLAALLHDGHKKTEIEAIEKEQRNGGFGYAASNAVTAEYVEKLRSKGVPTRVLTLIDFVGGMPKTLFAVKNILSKSSLVNGELALLGMYYIDAYTRGGAWAEPVDPAGINDIDRRRNKNEENPMYAKINVEATKVLQGDPFFAGIDLFRAMAVLGHEIEKKFAHYIKVKSGINIKPVKIPEMIDEELKKRVFCSVK
jgi:hypothetical protein